MTIGKFKEMFEKQQFPKLKDSFPDSAPLHVVDEITDGSKDYTVVYKNTFDSYDIILYKDTITGELFYFDGHNLYSE